MQDNVTEDEALAFVNEAFRNMDVEFNSDDLTDIAAALSSFAKASQKMAYSALKGLLDEVSGTPAIDSEAAGRAFAVLAGAASDIAPKYSLEEAVGGFRMIHDALADPSRPRQACGEIAAYWLGRFATGDTNVR